MPFVKGQRANPNGRPTGSKDKKARKKFSDYVSDADMAAIVKKIVECAKNGDMKAAQLATDHHFGKPAQAITGPDGGALEVAFKIVSYKADD